MKFIQAGFWAEAASANSASWFAGYVRGGSDGNARARCLLEQRRATAGREQQRVNQSGHEPTSSYGNS